MCATMTRAESVECLVVGGGPTGLATAAALVRTGAEVGIVVPPSPPGFSPEARAEGVRDGRTAALFPGSIALLRNLGVWPEIAEASAPIAAVRIVDDSGRLLRAPVVVFAAAEIG